MEALAEILVGAEDPDLLRGAEVANGRGREGVVGFEAIHRPDRDAERLDGGFGGVELGAQLGRHPLVTLIGSEQVVAERPDGVVECHGKVRHGFVRVAQQRHERRHDPHGGLEVAAVRRAVFGTRREVSPIQLEGSIDDVQAHWYKP